MEDWKLYEGVEMVVASLLPTLLPDTLPLEGGGAMSGICVVCKPEAPVEDTPAVGIGVEGFPPLPPPPTSFSRRWTCFHRMSG